MNRIFGPRKTVLAGCAVIILFIAIMVMAVQSVYTSETPYGDCLGLGETQTDSLVYEVPTGNVIVGIILVETVIVPAYIVLKDLYCPVGVKE